MKLSHVARLLSALLTLAALAAAPGAQGPVARAQAPARVAVVHAAPLAGAEVVTVAVDGAAADRRLGPVAYGEVLRYQDVAPGPRTFKLFPGNLSDEQLAGATPALTAAVTLEAGKDYTLVATGGVRGYPLELLRVSDDAARPAGAAAKVRLVHAAPFAAPAAATAVDIVAEDGLAIPGLLNIAYRGVSDYVTVPTGVTFDLKAVPSGRPGAAPVLDLPPFTLERGQVRTLVAIGGAGGRPPAVIELDLEDRLPTTVRVVHAAPAITTPVQVTLNGRVQWSGLSFAAAPTPVTVDEGTYTIAVEQPGDPPGTLAIARAELRRGREYLILVRPGADGEGVIVTVEPRFSEPGSYPENRGLLQVYHLAPFHTDGRSRIDLRNRFGQLIDPQLAGIAFGEKREALVPVREYDALYTTAGGAEVLGEVGRFTVQSAKDKVVTIFIVGDKDGAPSGSVLLAPPVRARYYLPVVGRQ